MPDFAIEAPSGVPQDAKQKMLREISEALDEAFHFPDIRGWLREYPAENVSQDGRVGAESRFGRCAHCMCLSWPVSMSSGSWSKRLSRRSAGPTTG
jgi:hypothetical protein